MQPKQTRVGRRRPRGMTLIEILVVLVILGLIMAAVGVSVVPTLGESKQDTAALDIASIRHALKRYHEKTGQFPDTDPGLRALVEARLLEKIPMDPWGREYLYQNDGGHPVITCYGTDGLRGGEGLDADLISRDLKRVDDPGR